LATRTQIKPFPFDRVFSERSVARARSETLSSARIEELEAECEQMKLDHAAALVNARTEAFQQGLEQARGERQVAVLAAVDALQASVEALGEGLAEIEQRLAREAAELAVTAADLLAARALELQPTQAIDAAIGRALNQIRRGEPVSIRVHPDLVADIEELVAQRQATERRRLSVTVLADPSLSLGDASLHWDQGGLRLDADARRAAVRAEIEGILPLETPN